MRIIKSTTNIDFMGYRHFMIGLSWVLVILSVGLLWKKGLRYGIDFAGGVEIQVRMDQSVDIGAVRSVLEGSELQDPSVVQMQGDQGHSEFLISLHGQFEQANRMADNVRSLLNAKFGEGHVLVRRVDAVGPKAGAELKKAGFYSMIYCLIAILIYVWFRFDTTYSPGAVLCLAHDSIITLGIFSLLGKEFNLTILAAMLTLIGYSLNDTIVVYDRIREMTEKLGSTDLPTIINKSINDTLSRTFMTGMTTLLAAGALFWKGGPVIHDFAFCMIFGVIIGTFSSIFVAAPLIIFTDKLINRTKAPKAKLQTS